MSRRLARNAKAVLGAMVMLAGLTLGRAAWAADEPADGQGGGVVVGPGVAINPAAAGADYVVQGEYEGALRAEPTAGAAGGKWGAQVVALGGGTFVAVLEPGGLPGQGWDGKTRVEIQGRLEGHGAAFGGGPGQYSAQVVDGTLKGVTDKGAAFELKKVERHSPTEGAKPPEGALVLFDGSNVNEWHFGKMDEQKRLVCGTTTHKYFGDFTLHVEFYLPFMPFARGQKRANSGVYLQKRYEIQILDSFGLNPDAGDSGSLYRQTPPLLNMSYPPLTWQTYDIDFTAARYDAAGNKLKNAAVTVKYNGVVVQDKTQIPGPTGAGKPEDKAQAIQTGPIYLQDHKSPVFFRNVWLVEKKNG